MEESYSIQKMLVLRKLTRAITDYLRGQMKEYLSTVAPLLRPKVVLGDYIQGSTKEPVKGADKAFKELQSLYETVASAKLLHLPKELKPPIEITGTALDITPMEYAHTAETDRESKRVIVTSPLKWVLSYSGFAPGYLKELLADKNRDPSEMQRFISHYLVLHIVMSKQTGITKMLEALHFPIISGCLPGFGELPITYISSSVSTIRPPDDVIIESTEISGTDAFEEIVNIEDIAEMRDPLKEQLIEIIKGYGEDLLPQIQKI